ncbi:AraC family transcriptional regulator [Paenibacillus hodogayensis]|uniref:AraC family transcriptional regulator n=1 Tax=Paenibacillus hodogayensis TaxID=279208 RepID=A0ABV5VUL7_9BACL
MVYMDIPYELDDGVALPTFRFKSIWKVHANDTYQVSKPHGFKYTGIFVTFEGEGSLKLLDQTFGLETGTYIIVPPSIPSAYSCVDGDWKFYFILFDPMEIVSHLDLSVGQPVTTAKMPDAVRLCERLIDNLIISPKGFGLTAQLSAQELLLHFAKEKFAYAQSRHPELDDILFQMHRQIGHPMPIDDLVRQSGLSRTVFFARFRSRTGMTPSRYIQQLKLATAKVALETTNASVKEIAGALQFYDEFHFSKLFKTRYGMAPSTYRQCLTDK